MLRLAVRSAALRARAAAFPAARGTHWPPSTAPSQWLQPMGLRALSTRANGGEVKPMPDGLVVGGVPLQELARRSRRDLQEDLGDARMRKVRQGLPQRWKSLLSAGKVAAPVVSHVFLAAAKLQLPKLMREVFDYSDEHYPERVDYLVYGEMFNMLSRAGKPGEILGIYERVKDRFSDERPAPEIVYRYGIYAKLGHDDFAGVEQLVQDMARHGIPVSNETASRVMAGLAKAGNAHSVLEIFASLDPQAGRWHPADVDRVISSLGRIGRADEAFEFYGEAQIQLSGNTLLSLLRVCELNDRPRHAMAVLANRKRFKLALNTRQFNRLLESLEFFDKREDMAAILQEMVDSRVPLDAATHAIITRNQEVLQGSKFAVSVAADGWEKRSRQLDEPLVKDLLAKRAFGDVAAVVDAYTQPVNSSDLTADLDNELRFARHCQTSSFPTNEATTVPSWLAVPAVTAYSSIGERHKLAGLLRGFSLVKSASVERALGLAAKLAAPSSDSRDPELLYHALKALQFQGHNIARARDAIDCFRGFNDIDAAIRLCQQTSRQLMDALGRSEGDAKAANRAVVFDRVHVLNATLQMLVEAYELSAVADLLNEVELLGLNVSAKDYAVLFSAMRTHNQRQRERGSVGGVAFDSADFEMIWTDMAQRGVTPTTRVISQICSAVRVTGSASMQQAVLEAYQQLLEGGEVATDSEDSYVMPLQCHTALLEMAARHATLEVVRRLYDDAVGHAEAAAAVMRAKPSLRRSAQREWTTVLVSKMAAEGDLEGAHSTLLSMPTECDAPPSYGGIMAVLKAAMAKADAGKAAEVLGLLREQHKQQRFTIKLKDVEEVVSAAIAQGDVQLAHEMLEIIAADVTKETGGEGEDQQQSTRGLPRRVERRIERRLLELNVQLLNALGKSEADISLAEVIDARVQDLTARVKRHEQQA